MDNTLNINKKSFKNIKEASLEVFNDELLKMNQEERKKALDEGIKKYIIRQWGDKIKECGINFLTIKKDKHDRGYYREEDIDILKRLKFLMYTKKFTMDGALVEIKNKTKNRSNYDFSNDLKLVSRNLRNLINN